MGITQPSSATTNLWVLLHDETLAATGRFDVSGFSQDHDFLVGKLLARTDQAVEGDSVYLFFNGNETVDNYRKGTRISGSGDLNVVSEDPIIGAVPGASAVANYFGIVEFTVYDYTNSFFKIINAFTGERRTATVLNSYTSTIHFESTAAVTQITLQPDGYSTDEFIVGSRFQLWGVG